MIHWRQMKTDAKIEAIKTVWRKGFSASQIAAHFDGVSRNAVIGLYHRYPDKMTDTPLGKAGPKHVKQPGAGKTIRTKPPASQPLVPARAYVGETQLVGKPLMMLEARECKWPVNDAAKGEHHLFCGLRADGSYCAHHAGRSAGGQPS